MEKMQLKIIPENPYLREPVLSNVWDFYNYESWINNFWETFQNILPKYSLDQLNESDIPFKDFLEEIFIQPEDFYNLLSKKLPYSNIRLAHATKTDDVNNFYSIGLIPLNHKNMENLFRKIFLNNDFFPEVTPIKIQQAIYEARRNLSVRENRIYFSIYENAINYNSCDFLTYGSEYLSVLTTYLSNCKHDKYKNYLKTIPNTQAVIFICDIQLPLINNYFEIYDLACNMAISRFLRNETLSQNERNFAVWSKFLIPPSQIIGHYYPKI